MVAPRSIPLRLASSATLTPDEAASVEALRQRVEAELAEFNDEASHEAKAHSDRLTLLRFVLARPTMEDQATDSAGLGTAVPHFSWGLSASPRVREGTAVPSPLQSQTSAQDCSPSPLLQLGTAVPVPASPRTGRLLQTQKYRIVNAFNDNTGSIPRAE